MRLDKHPKITRIIHISSFTHWFYIHPAHSKFEEGGFRIITMAVGDHPVGKHWYENKEELDVAVKRFESDGYKNMGYRA